MTATGRGTALTELMYTQADIYITEGGRTYVNLVFYLQYTQMYSWVLLAEIQIFSASN